LKVEMNYSKMLLAGIWIQMAFINNQHLHQIINYQANKIYCLNLKY